MDDAGPCGLGPARRLPEQRVDQRSGRMAGAGMDDDARGLVDDEQVLVLVGDPQIERFPNERGAHGRLQLDLLARLEPGRLRAHGAVDQHRTGLEQALGRRPRADLVQPGEKAVEPEPGRLRRDTDRDQSRAVDVSVCRRGLRSASSSDPSRTATPTTIEASARLNAGHQRRSRKSVT